MFRVAEPEGIPFGLELQTLCDHRAPAGFESFSLEFRGPAGSILPQATYGLEHPALGALAIFLVPVGASSEGVDYESVFNRRKDAP